MCGDGRGTDAFFAGGGAGVSHGLYLGVTDENNYYGCDDVGSFYCENEKVSDSLESWEGS